MQRSGDNAEEELRAHFTFDTGYDITELAVVITDEGVIFDAFVNGDPVATYAMMAQEWFDHITKE